MAHVVERTVLVASVHSDGAPQLIDLSIVGVEFIDEGVEVSDGFVKLLHLTECDGAQFECCGVGGVGCNGLSGLGDDFDRVGHGSGWGLWGEWG